MSSNSAASANSESNTSANNAANAAGTDAQAAAGSKTAGTAAASSTLATAENRELLQEGDSGDNVSALQNTLMHLGYMKRSTGYFGSETEAAVKAFQSDNALNADGVVGTRTWDVLLSAAA